jgi:hypothetical protein
MRPPPVEIVFRGSSVMLYAASYPAPVVFAVKLAYVRVEGVLVMTVTGVEVLFN